MEQALRDLCAQQGVDAVSVAFQVGLQHPFDVYLCWPGDPGKSCASGQGKTIEAAIRAAHDKMMTMRAEQAALLKQVA